MKFAQTIERLIADRVASRIARKDTALWNLDPPSKQMLGWVDCPEQLPELIARCTRFKEEINADGLTTAVVVGMGGSSAQLVAMAPFLNGAIRTLVMDTVHPDKVREQVAGLDIGKTLFLICSKSGSTVECLTLEAYLRDSVARVVGNDTVARHFVGVSDPGGPLALRAKKTNEFREWFATPVGVGGRYSALTAFGVLPWVIGGMDGSRLAENALKTSQNCAIDDTRNPALVLGAVIAEHVRNHNDKLTLLSGRELSRGFVAWAEQLLAESSGKNGIGVIPFGRENMDATKPSKLTPDRFYIACDAGAPPAGIESAYRCSFANPVELVSEMYVWQVAVAVAGHLLGFNPFDQPNVEKAKDKARQILRSGVVAMPATIGVDEAAAKICDGYKRGDWVAICAFIMETDDHDRLLAEIASTITAQSAMPVMIGYGPRYLHSTGQLIKGGPPTVRALYLWETPTNDINIPGRRRTFGELALAQAVGDYETLRHFKIFARL